MTRVMMQIRIVVSGKKHCKNVTLNCHYDHMSQKSQVSVTPFNTLFCFYFEECTLYIMIMTEMKN